MYLTRLFILLILFLLFVQFGYSQKANDSTKQRSNFSENLFTGGGLTLNFGTVTQLGCAPLVGYNINENAAVGIRGEYMYYRDNRDGFVQNIVGGSAFVRHIVYDNYFVQAEYSHVEFIQKSDNFYGSNPKYVFDFYYLGGGIYQYVGGNSYLVLVALWDFNEVNRFYFPNPTVRAGIVIGF